MLFISADTRAYTFKLAFSPLTTIEWCTWNSFTMQCHMHVLLYLYHAFFMQLCLHTYQSLHTGTQRDTHTLYIHTCVHAHDNVHCFLWVRFLMSFPRPCCLVMIASIIRLMKARMGTAHAFHLYRNLYPTHQAGLLSDLCVSVYHALSMQLFSTDQSTDTCTN